MMKIKRFLKKILMATNPLYRKIQSNSNDLKGIRVKIIEFQEEQKNRDDISDYLKRKEKVLCNVLAALDKVKHNYVFEYRDYIRASSLALISNEIYDNNIQGNVAELGVFQGNFAKMINKAFPDRKLYLFDTFEGFDERDKYVELKNNYSTHDTHVSIDFANTNIDIVLDKMSRKENCIIKKGYFPETAIGIDDVFSFVSIDADLYEPIYKGLHFFYERLNTGGYIMLHDYNLRDYGGAKVALKKFSNEKKVPYVPLCDSEGSA